MKTITKITAAALSLAIGASALMPVAAMASTGSRDPGVRIGGATNITRSIVVLHGAVAPDGHHTEYQFQYYVNSHRWNSTTTKNAGAARTFRNVSAKLTGLRPGTTYHYRLVAQNANATNPTHWVTFRTRS